MLARNEATSVDRSDFNPFSSDDLMDKHAKPRLWGIFF